MTWRAFLFFLLISPLAACGDLAASPPMLAAAQTEIGVDGQSYLVSHTRRRAEATRISRDPAPSRLRNVSRAARAMQTATGCEIRPGTLYGDTVMAEAMIDCAGTVPARLTPQYRFDEVGDRQSTIRPN